MNITLAEQLRGFYFSLGMGLFLGAVYDSFRLIRIFWNPPRRQLFFLDILCMLLLGVFTYLLFLTVSDGTPRLYAFLGECVGFFGYLWTAGKITERIARCILKFLAWLFWRPLQRCMRFFRIKAQNAKKKVYISIKGRQKHGKKT